MGTPIKPALSRSFGTESWLWVNAVANTSAPTTAELTAASAIHLQGYLPGEQEGIGGSTEKVTLPRRMMETQTFEVNGATSYSAPDFQLFFDPQAATGSDGKKAWEAMGDNEVGFLVHRQGVDPTTDYVAGQFVNVYPAQLGVKVPTKSGSGADGVYSFTVGVSITNTPAKNVAVAA